MKKSKKFMVLLGVAIGYSIALSFFDGGYDALVFYLKAPFPDTNAPAWVYLLTYPLSWFGWPLGWYILTFISVLVVGTAAIISGNKYWWAVLLSAPFLWNIWLGQIEFIPTLGLLISWLVYKKRIPVIWLGLSWLALLTKPQVGLGVLVMQFLWIWNNEIDKKELIPSIVVFLSTLFITVLIWPHWIQNWISTLRLFKPSWWNASIWPYGLVLWPIVLYLSRNEGPLRKIRMLSAVSLLGSPYFALYHSTTMLTITDNLLALLLSWIIIILGSGVPNIWMQWGWILPFGILMIDIIQILLPNLTRHER